VEGNEANPKKEKKETLMTTKQKTKRGRAPEQSAPPKTALLRARYSILKMLQRPFLGAFWFLEQRIARLQDQLARA